MPAISAMARPSTMHRKISRSRGVSRSERAALPSRLPAAPAEHSGADAALTLKYIFPPGNGVDRSDEFRKLSVLLNISVNARPYQVGEEFFAFTYGENDDFRLGQRSPELLNRKDSEEIGHGDIQDDDVRPHRSGQPQSFTPRACFADHGETGVVSPGRS